MTFSEQSRDRFLSFLADTGNVSRSAEAISISRTQAYRWRAGDPAFAADWDTALEAARGLLRELVLDTATVLGLGQWVGELDPITGEPVLDDELERVMRLDVSNVDARVLIKMLDRVLPAEVKRTAVRVEGGLDIRSRLDLDDLPMPQLRAMQRLLTEAKAIGVGPVPIDAEFVEAAD